MEGLTQFKFPLVSMSKFRNEGLGKEPRAPSAGDPGPRKASPFSAKLANKREETMVGECLEAQVPASVGKCGKKASAMLLMVVFFLCVCDNLL